MARYIDADIAIEEIDKLQESLMSNNDTIWKKNKPIYKGLCNARGIINDTPTADVVPKSECDKWYYEYHAIKDELKQEKMYHKETEKLVDKYCVELQTAKSEVEKLQNGLVIWKQNRFNLFQRLECYEMARQKVASEIFAEIDNILYKFSYPSLTAIGNINVMQAEGYHLRTRDYAELKKKYQVETK